MRRHVLVVVDDLQQAPAQVALGRWLAHAPRVVVRVPRPSPWVIRPWATVAEALAEAEAWLARAGVEGEVSVAPTVEALAAQAHGLVVLAGPDAGVSAWWACGVAVAWPGANRPGPAGRVAVDWPTPALAGPTPAWSLRRRGGSLSVLTGAAEGSPGVEGVAAEFGAVLGWRGEVALAPLPAAPDRPAAVRAWLAAHPQDLLVLPTPTHGLTWGLARHPWPCAVLAPPPRHASPLDPSDLLQLGDRLVGGVGHQRPLGALALWPGGTLRVVHAGHRSDPVAVDGGRLVVDDPGAPALGIETVADRPPRLVRVLRPGAAPIVLFDADLDGPRVARWPLGDRQRWAVRLRPGPARADAIAAGAHALLDAAAVLNDGGPSDLPSRVAPLRLLRVARTLRAAGHAVVLVAAEGAGQGFAAIDPAVLDGLDGPACEARLAAAAGPCPTDLSGPWPAGRALTDAQATTARRVEVEWDNGAALQGLIAQISAAQRRVHLQVYIYEEDAVGTALADRLIAAAARGVEVRVLVDALYSGHHVFGRENAVLSRLDAAPGVWVRASRPVDGLPSVVDLKGRDHRKLVVVDGRVARLTGRNVGAPYYTGFEAVELTRESPWLAVPWLDAGVVLEGAVVAALDAVFEGAWRAAGGPALPALDPGPPGDIPAALVVHRALRDAHTVDTYRALIDGAQRSLTVVNTFPVQQELVRALRDAVARGVAVRFLVGNVQPLHGPERAPFAGAGPLRELATEVVHGRLDALAVEGVAVYEYACEVPGLGRVWPHVHAKLVCADRRLCSIGSANLDVTAGYWESEALLVLDHGPTVAGIADRLDALFAQSDRVDPADAAWQARAARRAWISQHWPSVIG